MNISKSIHKAINYPSSPYVPFFQKLSTKSNVVSRYHVCFSGAGHLLPYHLGVCSYLNETIHPDKRKMNIASVSGSSSGAIAATLYALLSPSSLDSFTNQFIEQGGGGISLLQTIMQKMPRSTIPKPLYIFMTPCKDSTMACIHPFSNIQEHEMQRLFSCIQASCRIPTSFHPMDILHFHLLPSFTFFSSKLSYPESDGVTLDGISYVDGGIAAPFPNPLQTSIVLHDRPNVKYSLNVNQKDHVIMVSPLSYTHKTNIFNANYTRISPNDSTFSFLPNDVIVGSTSLPHNNIRPSIQNIHALRVSMGAANKIELQQWYELGKENAKTNLSSLFKS